MELYPRDSLSNMTTTECNASPNRAKKQKMACATNISKSIHEVLRYACQPKSQAKRNVSRRRKYEKPSRVKCGITLFCRGITSHSNNGNRRCHKGSISRIRTMLMMSFDECLVIAVFLHLSLAFFSYSFSPPFISAVISSFSALPGAPTPHHSRYHIIEGAETFLILLPDVTVFVLLDTRVMFGSRSGFVGFPCMIRTVRLVSLVP